MHTQKDNWNDFFEDKQKVSFGYDLWLDKYDQILASSQEQAILDIGCGIGNNGLYLTEKGFNVIACDFSEKAINIVEELLPNAETKVFDMLNTFPFENNSQQVIIADLSIHYFYWNDTVKIVREINRILKKNGYFIGRVNSTNDINHGAGQGIELEENFYKINNSFKRFFTKKQLRELFSINEWRILNIDETEMNRYSKPKVCWEFIVKKV